VVVDLIFEVLSDYSEVVILTGDAEEGILFLVVPLVED